MIIWRDAHGVQHTETHRTLAEAREAKRGHEADVARGEFCGASAGDPAGYAREWIERYQGTGRRGFRGRPGTSTAACSRYALKYFSPRCGLGRSRRG